MNTKKVILMSSVISAVCFAPLFLTAIIPAVGTHMLYFLYALFIALIMFILLLTGLFSVVVVVIKKFKKKKPGAFEVSILSACVTGAALVLIFNLIPKALPTGSELIKFDTAVWKQEMATKYDGNPTLRQKMLKDLVDNLLPGEYGKGIESLLGPSSKTEHFKSKKMDLIYYTGSQRDRVDDIDSEWLLIWLDSKGKFRKYEVVCD